MNRTDLARRTGTLAISCLLLGAAVARAQPPDGSPRRSAELLLMAGEFNFGHGDPTTLYGFELRGQLGRPRVFSGSRITWRPTLGVLASSESALFGYAGLRLDVEISPRWRLTPGFDAGTYSRGDDIDLGYALEFKSSLEVSCAITPRQRLGATIFHMSNASLSEVNPGANSIAATYLLRFGGGD